MPAHEPRDLTGETVLELARSQWGLKPVAIAPQRVTGSAYHWVLARRSGPRWFATAENPAALLGPTSGSAQEHTDAREEALEAAGQAAWDLASAGLGFVCAPLPARRGGYVVRHGRYLVRMTRYLAGEAGTEQFADDAQRAVVCSHLGQLHATEAPAGCPRWEPDLASAQALTDLLADLDSHRWLSGPYGRAARDLLEGAAPVLRERVHRHGQVAREVAGAPGWVVTHGEPVGPNVLWQTGGAALLDWESVAVAPRERDLGPVLRDADTAGPLAAYVTGGGTADVTEDCMDLVELDRTLRVVAFAGWRFSRPHDGGCDDGAWFAAMEAAVS